MSKLLLDLIIFTGEWVGATIIIFLILSHDDLCSSKRSKCPEANGTPVGGKHWGENISSDAQLKEELLSIQAMTNEELEKLIEQARNDTKNVIDEYDEPVRRRGCGQTLPTVDTVPVVRCGECEYFTLPQGYCYLGMGTNGKNFYCAAGKRKEQTPKIVRCKDCKYYMTIHCTCDGCCISPDWYCADGERREADV